MSMFSWIPPLSVSAEAEELGYALQMRFAHLQG